MNRCSSATAQRSRTLTLAAAFFLLFQFGSANIAKTAEFNPLRPVDMSSPRATLEGFIASMDGAYTGSNAIIIGYAASDRLYLSPDERQHLAAARAGALTAVQSLDTSKISPVLRDIVAVERAIQLKEILDRIGLPPFEAIPDRDAVSRDAVKRWRVPETEIDIVLIAEGLRSGDFLVSAETVERLPQFFELVKHLPYRPGPAKQLSDTYRAMTGSETATIYDIISNSPIGLDRVIPTRWMVRQPDWAKSRVAGVAVWQWLGFVFGLLLAAIFIFGAYRLARRLARRRGDEAGLGWCSLLTPLAIIAVAGAFIPLLSLILRIGGTPRAMIAFTQTTIVFLSAAWVCVIGGGLLGETIATSEHLTRRSLDGQLLRLGVRFVGIVLAVGLLTEAANELGFPSYSVLAGLGVGGLAIALAARDSLANLLGSVLIMFEKPFRVGHMIRVSGSEGTVEDVGFRSTRIRTTDNSLISIPNNAVVNATVENLSLRAMRRQRFLLQLTYDTPREKMEALAAGVKRVIDTHPITNKDNYQVWFNEFGENSLNILVIFYLIVSNITDELCARENILFQIMNLAKEMSVEFAFPTRTLHVETMPTAVTSELVSVDARTPPARTSNRQGSRTGKAASS